MTEAERRLRAMEEAAERRREAAESAASVDMLEHIADVYKPVHADIEAHKHEYYNLPGGRGSGKSSFCALEIVNGIMQDNTGESSAIVFRRTAATMRESVYSQIAWAIETLDAARYWKGSVSPMCYTYLPTGAQILFRGLDDTSKLKSIKPRRGAFRYVWIEEFSELPGENFNRSIMQSVIRGGNDFCVLRSFNPPLSINNWANKYIARPDNRALTVKTTYKDVPAEWIGEDFIEEAERLKEVNPAAYDHEYLGIPTGTGGEVFPNIEARTITEDEITQLQYIYAGIDFGFAIDPAVFIQAAYDRKTETVYLLNEIYKKHCSNKQLADAIKAQRYDKTGRLANAGIYGSFALYEERQTIICDSAEPKSINDLQAEGLKVIACRKFPGCVQYRIKWLQNRRIVIDPARTPNAYREFTEYEYLQTKDGEFLADVPDADNHTIDALSYGLDRIIYDRRQPA